MLRKDSKELRKVNKNLRKTRKLNGKEILVKVSKIPPKRKSFQFHNWCVFLPKFYLHINFVSTFLNSFFPQKQREFFVEKQSYF